MPPPPPPKITPDFNYVIVYLWNSFRILWSWLLSSAESSTICTCIYNRNWHILQQQVVGSTPDAIIKNSRGYPLQSLCVEMKVQHDEDLSYNLQKLFILHFAVSSCLHC